MTLATYCVVSELIHLSEPVSSSGAIPIGHVATGGQEVEQMGRPSVKINYCCWLLILLHVEYKITIQMLMSFVLIVLDLWIQPE